ncbi:uncharacterized protein LOC123918959 [Trifolium pratense]|nr:uncharacterized protein LOC123916154 [Trifolium pratense]XP_045827116.1 uncharacterized protein LOC123918959 [Trifolium pratense]
METVGSTRLGRASSRYGAPAVFNGRVRKWEKKWVHVSPSSFNNNSKNKNDNGNDKSRLLLRRWTPVTNTSSSSAADEPPRRKFRYTPIAALEEQKKGVAEKVENESTIESDQMKVRQTDVNHGVHRKLNMNEILDNTKDSNMNKLDLDLDFQGNNGENNQDSDD